MPGNGVGDRVHNSFDQENLSQGQHHFKAVDKSWPGLSNNIWGGSQTQGGLPLISNLKNYGVPQSANIDSGHGIPSFQAVNGFNSAQPNFRSEVAGSQFQNQQTALNGFMQGTSAPRQYETNFMGMDADSYQNTLTSKGLPILESHHGNGTDLQKKDYGRFPTGQSPVSFNSYGGQEQMSSQHQGLMQSLQRQQSGIHDMQLLQQQMFIRQLQDNQRQSFQHQGVWQQNAPMNLLPSMANQAAPNHTSALLNGIPVHDSSNKPWPSNPNRQHLGASGIMQGSSNGFELSSEQSQAFRSMGLVLQQGDQSLYGVPVSGARDNLNQTSQIQSESPVLQQISSFGNSFSRNQHAAPSDRDTKDGRLDSRQVGSSAGHNSTGGLEFNNLQQLPPSQRNVPLQEYSGKLELSGLSDTSQEKTTAAAVHSQNVATLDPAEEKILFGSDDNLWEAFGGEVNTGLGGINMPEGGGLFGGPSLQSGSWSALMQSALGETSSAETGQQEEWSGLNFRSTEPTTGHQQPSNFNDGVRQEHQSAWGGSSMPAGSSSAGALGHQLDRRASQERIENMQPDSYPRFMQDSSEGNKRLEPNLSARPSSESIQISGKTDNSSVADRKLHTSGSWTHQQSTSSFDARTRLNDIANGWNAFGSSSRVPAEGSHLKSQSSEMVPQPSQSSSQNRQAHDVRGGTAGKNDAFHGLAVGSDQLKPLGGATMHRQDSSTNNSAVNSSSSKALQESTHWLQNNQSHNFWRQVDSSANSRGSEGWGTSPHLGKGSKEFESSGDNDERQNSSKRENSTGFLSNVSRHASPGFVQDNACIDVSDSHILHGAKENSSGRAGQKSAGVPKFQYHPMGDLDVNTDSYHGAKSGAYPQAANQPVFNKSSPVGGLSENRSSQPSQNMLELLHKLDQSKDRETASHFSSSDRNDAHEAETSDGSVGQLQRNQSPRSQGFGLQLAPPSQRSQNLDRAILSSDRSGIGQMPSVSAQSGPSLSSWKEPYEGENRNHTLGASEPTDDKSSMGFIPGFPFSRNHLQNQRDGGRSLPSQLVNPTLHRLASQSKVIENTSEGILRSQSGIPSIPDLSAGTSKGSNAAAVEGSQSGVHGHSGSLPPYSVLEAFPMSRPSLTPGVPHQNVFSRGLSSTAPSLLKHASQSHDNDSQKGVGGPMELSANATLKPPESSRTGEAAQSALQGKVSSANHVSDGSLPRSVPNDISHQSYSLLHQVQTMKSPEVDPGDRTFKRFKGAESGVNSEFVPLGGDQLSYGQPSGPRVDTRVFNLSGNQSDNWDASSPSPHVDALRRSGSPHSSNNSEASLRPDHSQVNSQMVPSWAGQPGTMMNGQALQGLDAQRMAAMKHMEQDRLVQKPVDGLPVHEPSDQLHHDSGVSPVNTGGYGWLSASVRTEKISTQNSLPPEVTDQTLLVKEKKRKIPLPEVQAWHKEVMTSARLHSSSTTEIEWARAANRVIQKMQDETQTNDDGHPLLRTKKRLVLTSQLMQQLLRPPPAPFLAGDGRSHYENVTYCVSKSALGDACRAIHFSSDNPSTPNSSEKISLEIPKVSERSESEDFVKAVECSVDRKEKLENELLRLDQRPSLVDLRVELQDLERFSIINRFAKFHGRSQSDGSGAASSSDPLGYASRPMPQRYVVALPMPKNLPDSVQCLSL